MLQSLEISDTEISSAVGYVPHTVSVVDTQLEGGIIPRTTLYVIHSVFIKKGDTAIGMYCVCLIV